MWNGNRDQQPYSSANTLTRITTDKKHHPQVYRRNLVLIVTLKNALNETDVCWHNGSVLISHFVHRLHTKTTKC